MHTHHGLTSKQTMCHQCCQNTLLLRPTMIQHYPLWKHCLRMQRLNVESLFYILLPMFLQEFSKCCNLKVSNQLQSNLRANTICFWYEHIQWSFVIQNIQRTNLRSKFFHPAFCRCCYTRSKCSVNYDVI